MPDVKLTLTRYWCLPQAVAQSCSLQGSPWLSLPRGTHLSHHFYLRVGKTHSLPNRARRASLSRHHLRIGKTHRLSNHARRASLSRHHFYLRTGKTHKLSDRFFFDLFILACDLCRSWRRTFLPGFPVGSPRGGGSLQAPLLPSAQACPKKE